VLDTVDCQAMGQICLTGSCVDLRCVPGKRYCDGESLRQCSSDGLRPVLLEECTSNLFCDDAALSCRPEVCAPDAPFCDGERAQVCNARGSGPVASGTDCATLAGERCQQGACVCQPNRADCDGDASNGCEINTLGDPAHCGGCGIACSGNQIPSPACSAGICTGSCQSGYADCNANRQADGCETDVLSSPGACGGCGQSCSANHMQTRTCSGGACNGTCSAGYADCNGDKRSDGCEQSLLFDEGSCGACGYSCATGESCVNGSCRSCNNAVLLLGDGAFANDELALLMQNAGLDVTLVNPGFSTYQGSPPASDFGAVALPIATGYYGFPVSGQAAVAAAHAAGTGVVFTEWASYAAMYDWDTPLASLVLSTFESYVYGTPATYTLTAAGHPIWDGLPTTFTTTRVPSHVDGTLINGGVQIADCDVCNGAGVIVRDDGGGRIVEITHSASFDDPYWAEDPYLAPMFVNAVKWATGCF
jgi:hypothetical protein